jgi:DNA-binding LytR/AlgR family response regulator
MKTIRCMVVDDEPLAQRVVENYAREIPGLEIVSQCRNGREALAAFQGEEIDLLLLDIEMPRLSGLGLVRSLPRPPLVIFITAYEEHALESYELEAVDYLKKPYAFERFVQAINKARRRLVEQEATPVADDTMLFVKTPGEVVRLDLADIILVEGMGDYVKVRGPSPALVSHQTLQQWEQKLPAADFARVHKSYIVRLDRITAIKSGTIRLGEHSVPIGRSYRAALQERIGEF